MFIIQMKNISRKFLCTAVIFDSPAGVEIKIQQDSASGDNFDNWAFTGFTVAPAGGGGGLDPATAIQLNDNVN